MTEQNFEEIYEKYYIKVYRFLYRLSGEGNLSEELAQDTLYKGFLHMNQYEGRSSIFTWLCEIAKNEWLAELNRRKRFSEPEEDWEPVSGESMEEDAINRQLLVRMREEILRLQEPYRNVMMLRTYGELPLKEIAAQYKKTESWARVTYYRAKEMLAERMEK